MRKVIFGIFAHPDDEAFGPSGTLLKETKDGTELHLITLTAGEHGSNATGCDDLGATRLAEWRTGGALMQASSMHHWGYRDSHLTNESMIEIAERLESEVRDYLVTASSDTVIELMSFDENGISGHIDHIVASRAACQAFYRLKDIDTRVQCLRLFCICQDDLSEVSTSWIYMSPGHTHQEIDETIDAREHREKILAIMRAHESQSVDYQYHLARLGDRLGINHFIVHR